MAFEINPWKQARENVDEKGKIKKAVINVKDAVDIRWKLITPKVALTKTSAGIAKSIGSFVGMIPIPGLGTLASMISNKIFNVKRRAHIQQNLEAELESGDFEQVCKWAVKNITNKETTEELYRFEHKLREAIIEFQNMTTELNGYGGNGFTCDDLYRIILCIAQLERRVHKLWNLTMALKKSSNYIQAYIAQVLTGADAGNIISSMSTPINLQTGEGQLKGLQGAYTLVNDLLSEQSEVAYKVAKQLLTWSSGTNITPQGFHSFLKYVALYQQKGEQPSMSAHYQDFRKLIIRLYPFGATGEIDNGVTSDMHEAIRDTILRHSQCRHWCCFNPNPGAMTLPNDLASHAERVYNAINEARTHTIDSFIYE